MARSGALAKALHFRLEEPGLKVSSAASNVGDCFILCCINLLGTLLLPIDCSVAEIFPEADCGCSLPVLLVISTMIRTPP